MNKSINLQGKVFITDISSVKDIYYSGSYILIHYNSDEKEYRFKLDNENMALNAYNEFITAYSNYKQERDRLEKESNKITIY